MEAPGIKVRYIISSTNREALRGLMVKARPGVDFRRRWELHLFLKTHFFRGGGNFLKIRPRPHITVDMRETTFFFIVNQILAQLYDFIFKKNQVQLKFKKFNGELFSCVDFEMRIIFPLTARQKLKNAFIFV